MLAIYTTEDILTAIYQDQEHKYDGWYEFITKVRPTLNVLMKEGTDYEDNDYNPVFMLENGYDIQVEPEFTDEVGENSYIAKIEKTELNCVTNPFAILFSM